MHIYIYYISVSLKHVRFGLTLTNCNLIRQLGIINAVKTCYNILIHDAHDHYHKNILGRLITASQCG